VAALAEAGAGQFAPLYDGGFSLFDKINTIATRIYRADEAIADSGVRNQLHAWEKEGHGTLPICMAKTQYSFSTDPALLGAPSHHVVPVREVRLAAGAGFVVAVCGDLMTMPGLPRTPSAEGMRIGENGLIEGLS
jgi:formate--tetrahydrofolate ligase